MRSELEFYIDKEIENYLCLHPTDFQLLADEVLAKRDAAMDAQIEKKSVSADRYIDAVRAKSQSAVNKGTCTSRCSNRKK